MFRSVVILFVLCVFVTADQWNGWTNSLELEGMGRHTLFLSAQFRSPEQATTRSRALHTAHRRIASSLRTADSDTNTEKQWLLKVKGPLSSSSKFGLDEGLGFNLTRYVPDDGFVFVATTNVAERIRHYPGVIGLEELSLDVKISPKIYEINTSGPEVRSTDSQSSSALSLLVDLEPWEDDTSLQTAVESWREGLGASVDISISSSRRLIVTISDISKSYEIIAWLATQARVLWVEPKPVYKLQNKYAHKIVQSGQATGSNPFWDAGITGSGEVLAVADTGLDWDHCHFADGTLSPTFGSTNSLHRKIVGYQVLPSSDKGDYVGGHGTHVCGIAVGNPITALSEEFLNYSGVAPSAKIIFQDAMAGEEDSLNIPADLSTGLFPWTYNQGGARVHSNSWGADDNSYSSNAADIDRYMYSHPDFLVLVAAGNDGPKFNTVGEPATAKNCISVGATQNARESYVEQGTLTALGLYLSSSLVSTFQFWFDMSVGDFNSLTKVLSGKLVVGVPSDGCSAFTNLASIRGNILVLDRGTCTFNKKMARAQSAGAIAVIMINDVTGPPAKMCCQDTSITIVGVMVSIENGTFIKSAVANDTLKIVRGTIGIPLPDSPLDRFVNVVDYSSKGPTADGRIKPDVAAPGDNIYSANSDGKTDSFNCGENSLLLMSGTSMATPLVAGTAALVRQYFKDGYYPTGKKTPGDSIAPSAALVKCIIIASSQPLFSYWDASGNFVTDANATTPNNFSGFGLVNIAKILFLKNYGYGSGVAPSLFVTQDRALGTGESFDVCFKARFPLQEFRATLVWTDPEGSPSAWRILINDLNLVVYDNSTQIRYLGNGLPTADNLNNVERVIINPTDESYFVVSVSAASVAVGVQMFALAVSGYFEQQSAPCSRFIGCANGCSANGHCVSGLCVCLPSYSGVNCNTVNPRLSFGPAPTAVSIPGQNWKYFSIAVPLGVANFELVVLSTTGDPDFYFRFGAAPLTTTYDSALLDCDSCASANASKILTIDVAGRTASLWVLGIFSYGDSSDSNTTFYLNVSGCVNGWKLEAQSCSQITTLPTTRTSGTTSTKTSTKTTTTPAGTQSSKLSATSPTTAAQSTAQKQISTAPATTSPTSPATSAPATSQPETSRVSATSITVGVCGDGVKGRNENCDDGNSASGDGCSSTCFVESGFTCGSSDTSPLANVCVCLENYFGPSCVYCTNSTSCNSNGFCRNSDGKCQCFPSFFGSKCEIKVEPLASTTSLVSPSAIFSSTVTFPNSSIGVSIPPGALGAAKSISVTSYPSSAVIIQNPSANITAAGPVSDFGPDGLSFTVPVTLTLPFNAASLANSANTVLTVHWYNPGSAAWEQIPNGEIDSAAGTIKANVNHFSMYAAMAMKLPTTPSPSNPSTPSPSSAPSSTPWISPGEATGDDMSKKSKTVGLAAGLGGGGLLLIILIAIIYLRRNRIRRSPQQPVVTPIDLSSISAVPSTYSSSSRPRPSAPPIADFNVALPSSPSAQFIVLAPNSPPPPMNPDYYR